MSQGLTPVQAGGIVGAILAAAAGAATLYVGAEGWRTTPYKDPVNIWTVCAGDTRNVQPGKTLSDQECVARTAVVLAQHGAEIAGCLPAQLPTDTRAAFTSFGSNVGKTKFCASTLSKKARAGDLKGACAELSRWTYAGGQVLPGLVRRRAAERALCEKGLVP